MTNWEADWIGKPVFSVGKLIKWHGIGGGMVVLLNRAVNELIGLPEWIFIHLEGAPVPFQCDQEETYLKDSRHLVITLKGFKSRDSVVRFMPCPIGFPGTWSDWFIHNEDERIDLSGYQVYDENHNESGIVTGLRQQWRRHFYRREHRQYLGYPRYGQQWPAGWHGFELHSSP